MTKSQLLSKFHSISSEDGFITQDYYSIIEIGYEEIHERSMKVEGDFTITRLNIYEVPFPSSYSTDVRLISSNESISGNTTFITALGTLHYKNKEKQNKGHLLTQIFR